MTVRIVLAGVLAGVTATLGASARAQAPTDPQIVGIVLAANQIDIDAGNAALAKAHSPEVKAFAQQMVTDHSALQKSVKELGAKLHVVPAPSPTAASLKSQAATTAARLKTLHGDAYDKAYIDNEVAYHQAVIDAVSNVLIPNAQNAELKNALVGAAPAFQGHLKHAQMIQTSLH
ncbi:DUF4142 domain-containing protein [Terriglobus sp. TAA 43]|uniref:DUF4142 domain-containing protein n=1 Tax=Terriglobus sp. TAA 43 TaxID=278961 RepID=UPI00068F6B3C|nr:DUF4142 domain-containing protein [Terriglobus sp. TAA 43]